MCPRAATQPSSGGIAPGKAPINVANVVTRFKGVYTSTYVAAVASVSTAVSALASRSSSAAPAAATASASETPCTRPIRPVAIGRRAVRIIRASERNSIASFSAAAPALSSPIPSRTPIKPGCMLLTPDRSDPR